MVGVVTETCIKCKKMDCVEVCPVDAFYEGENMLVINPRECVDCGCCIQACPVDAIYFDTEPQAAPWIELNDRYSRLWPNVIYDGGQTPRDADSYKSVANKYELYFSPKPGAGDIGTRARTHHKAACSSCGDSSLWLRFLTLLKSLRW